MACEMAEYWRRQGKTLYEALQSLYKKHGYYKEGLDGLTLEGKSGQEKIGLIMDNFRKEVKTKFGEIKTLYVEDYSIQERTFINGSKKSEPIDLPQENVVKYVLEDQCWVCLRPSGTEPKIKWYFGAYGNNKSVVDERLQMLQKTLHEIIVQPLELTR